MEKPTAKPSVEDLIPKVEPGEKWVAQDGKEYTVHKDGTTLIDEKGDYYSPFWLDPTGLRPLPKEMMDRIADWQFFDAETIDAIIAAS